MKRLTVVCLLLGYVLLAAADDNSSDNSLLWKITGKNLQKPSYLFGTIHIFCEDNFAFKPKVSKALNSAEQLYLEIDMDDGKEMQSLMEAVQLKGKTLKDLIDDEKEAEIDALMKKILGVGLEQFNQSRPFAIYAMLAYKSAGCALPITYEMELMNAVKKNSIDVYGLETAAEQLKMIERSGMDDANSLLDHLKNQDENTKIFIRLSDLYRQENLTELNRLVVDYSEDMGYSMEYILDERNKNWVKKMPEIMQDKSVFFAVGAGHLAGENGVINLLKKNGYTVEAVH